MILDEQTVDNIIASVVLAKQFDIESIIVYPDKISGMSENSTAAIFTLCENDIGCASIGINRLALLSSRIALIDAAELQIECVYDYSDSYANMLRIKSKKMKIGFRCANATKIKAPASLAVKPLYKLEIPEEAFNILSKSKRAMKADEVVILSEDGNLTYRLLDGDNDELLYSEGTAVNIEDEFTPVNFIIRYPISYILKVLKDCDTREFYVMEKDLFHCNVNGQGVYIPKKK